ncbi:MAG: SH3 domain-containing protein [Proteobacteria bacterium]|nr:SH3 domain-containing protein [Desulfobulbaceae bacterium]MBU4153255.1 SH3 domain-containing protein [Pseudomonadota bacterium]
MKRLLTAFLIIFVTLVTTVQAQMVSIAREEVNMRSGPGTRHPVMWELGRGFPLKTLERKGNWLRVKDFEGDTGWVYRKLTDKTPFVVVSRKIVNIRSGPGKKYQIVGKAEYGTVLKLIKKGKGWVNVKHSSKIIGWIKGSLVWGW